MHSLHTIYIDHCLDKPFFKTFLHTHACVLVPPFVHWSICLLCYVDYVMWVGPDQSKKLLYFEKDTDNILD